MTDRYVVGIDIGGTKCAVSHGDLSARVDGSVRFPTAGMNFDDILPRFVDAVDSIRSDRAGAPPEAIGISCGGPLDSGTGTILSPPNLPGWDDVPIVDLLSGETGVPCFLENDANACALAEWRFGAGRGTSDMVFCTMGTGFGAGLILGGRLHRGIRDGAGEIGHVRLTPDGPYGYGKHGSVEGYCGGSGIADLARIRIRERHGQGEDVGLPDEPNAKDVGDAAEAGNPLAAAIYSEVGTMLGRALAVLIDLLNPELIVVGSIFARSEELIRPAMEEAIAAEALPLNRALCRIAPAELGERLGDIASLTVAVEGLRRVSSGGISR